MEPDFASYWTKISPVSERMSLAPLRYLPNFVYMLFFTFIQPTHNKSPRYVCMLHRDRNSRRGHAMNVVASSGTPANFTANPISRDPSSTISLRLNPDAGVTGRHANNNWRRKGSGDIKGE